MGFYKRRRYLRRSALRSDKEKEEIKEKYKIADKEYEHIKRLAVTSFLGDFLTGGLLISGIILVIDYLFPESVIKLIFGIFLITFALVIWIILVFTRYYKKKFKEFIDRGGLEPWKAFEIFEEARKIIEATNLDPAKIRKRENEESTGSN